MLSAPEIKTGECLMISLVHSAIVTDVRYYKARSLVVLKWHNIYTKIRENR
jgi:hypothetical protein